MTGCLEGTMLDIQGTCWRLLSRLRPALHPAGIRSPFRTENWAEHWRGVSYHTPGVYYAYICAVIPGNTLKKTCPVFNQARQNRQARNAVFIFGNLAVISREVGFRSMALRRRLSTGLRYRMLLRIIIPNL
jgi:hypothetical protein